MPADAEPAVDPQHLLQSLRRFLTMSAATPATTANADKEGELGFEEAGTLVWDATMMPDDAAFLMGELPELPGALAAAAAAAAAHKRWRALEICLGILGNLACHPRANRRILEEEGLPTACLAKLLWVDDAASLAELLRLITGVLGVPDSCQVGTSIWHAALKSKVVVVVTTTAHFRQAVALGHQACAACAPDPVQPCLTLCNPLLLCGCRPPSSGGRCSSRLRPWEGWCG